MEMDKPNGVRHTVILPSLVERDSCGYQSDLEIGRGGYKKDGCGIDEGLLLPHQNPTAEQMFMYRNKRALFGLVALVMSVSIYTGS